MKSIQLWRWWGWLAGCLYLVGGAEENWWKPGPGINWDWRLSGNPKATAGVDVFDIDLFDVDASDMQSLSEAGIVIICYFSAGTYENYREDEGDFPRSALGKPVEYSEGEWWVNINDEGVRDVMEARLQLAASKGCDGVDPDAVEGFSYDSSLSGWTITPEEQLSYNKWIADQAHALNLSVGLKNDPLQVEELEPWFDWALSTDCASEDSCDVYEPFFSAGKAVLDAEFEVANLDFCNGTFSESIDFIVKDYSLDNRRCSCGFPETNVDCSSVLSAMNTEEPTSSGDVDGGAGDDTTGDGGEGTPTWVIVTAIAMGVLMMMMAYGAVVWRRVRRRKGIGQGVEDF